MTLEKRARVPYLLPYRSIRAESTSLQRERIIRKIEDMLTKSRAFTLPGKKKLASSNYQLEVIVVDVTESPIERPKKNKKSFTVEKRNSIHLSHK